MKMVFIVVAGVALLCGCSGFAENYLNSMYLPAQEDSKYPTTVSPRTTAQSAAQRSEAEAWKERVAAIKNLQQGKTKSFCFEGDEVNVGCMTYKVERSWWSNRLSKNEYLDQKPNALYLFVKVTVRNDDKKPRMIPDFKLLNRNGAIFESSVNGCILSSSLQSLDSLNPSVSKTGIVVFDIPLDSIYEIWFPDGFGSNRGAGAILSPKPL